MESRIKIDELEQAGRITAEEAGRLREALGSRRRGVRAFLLYPLEALPTGAVALVAAGVGLASLVFSWRWGVRFDGALDVHLGARHPLPLAAAALDVLVAWPLTALVLWLVARLAGARGWLVDMVLSLGAVRLPLLATAAAVLALGHGARSSSHADVPPSLLLLAVALLPLLAWQIWLFFSAFRHASGLQRERAALTFVVAIIVAEALSKVILLRLPLAVG